MKPALADSFITSIEKSKKSALNAESKVSSLVSKKMIIIRDELRVNTQFLKNDRYANIPKVNRGQAIEGVIMDASFDISEKLIDGDLTISLEPKGEVDSSGYDPYRLNFSRNIYLESGRPTVIYSRVKNNQARVITIKATSSHATGKRSAPDLLLGGYQIDLFKTSSQLATQINKKLQVSHEVAYSMIKDQGEMIRSDVMYSVANGKTQSLKDCYIRKQHGNKQNPERTLEMGVNYTTVMTRRANDPAVTLSFNWVYHAYSRKPQLGKSHSIIEVIAKRKSMPTQMGKINIIPATANDLTVKTPYQKATFFYAITPFYFRNS